MAVRPLPGSTRYKLPIPVYFVYEINADELNVVKTFQEITGVRYIRTNYHSLVYESDSIMISKYQGWKNTDLVLYYVFTTHATEHEYLTTLVSRCAALDAF